MPVQPAQPKPWSPLQKPPTKIADLPDGRVHIDGMRWDIVNNADGSTREEGVFADAYIQPEAVREVFLGITPFTDKPGGHPGHAQLHFRFHPDSPVTGPAGLRDDGLVLSVEPRFYEGEPWMPDGDNPQPVVYQLCSWLNSVEKSVDHHKYPIQLFRLKLDHSQQVALLRERLELAVQDHSQDIYDPVTNSCISTLVQGVNQVVPDPQKIPRTDPNVSVPVWCSKSFKKYRLVGSTSPDQVISVPQQDQ